LIQKGAGSVHKLIAMTALGQDAPQRFTTRTITIAENPGVALASVAARRGKANACARHLTSILGAVPEVGRAVLNDPEAGFWMGPDQWMLGAPISTHEDLADKIKAKMREDASVTEQTGAWVIFDVTGFGMLDLCERLCAIPIRQMRAGDVRRTQIHQLGCFVIRRTASDHIRILGPRASAVSLFHALTTAAQSAT
jgi:sarcosine oxidase subunit gamma